jgi:hypothetical protein
MTDDLVRRLRNRAESWLEYECDDDAKIDIETADRIEELEGVFHLRWECDMRAIKRWRDAHPGNDSVWPDGADLCVWLMDRIEDLQDTIARIQYINLRRDMNVKNRTIEIEKLCKGEK